jgi:outer membrane protein
MWLVSIHCLAFFKGPYLRRRLHPPRAVLVLSQITNHEYSMNHLHKLQLPGSCAINPAPGTLRWVGRMAIAGIVFSSNLASAEPVNSPVQGAPVAGGIIGLGAAALPEYPGSDQVKVRAVPVFEYHWANGLFMGGEHDTLVGFQVSTPSQLQYGVALGVDEGRKEYRDGPLAGMGKISAKGVLVSYVSVPVTGRFSIDSNLRLGSGNDNSGALLKLGAAYRVALSPSAQLSFNVGGAVANGAYMRSYFGVSVAQALTSSYGVYAPSAGLLDLSIGMRLFWQIDRNVSLLAGASSSHFGNVAEDSPFVRKSNTQKLFFGIARNI